MTTTEMIELLKNYEFGGVTGRAREISFYANHLYIPHSGIFVEGTGDGLITDISFRLEFKPVTNADRIRSMTDEELARFLIDNIGMHTHEQTNKYIGDFFGTTEEMEEALALELEWLQSDAENAENDVVNTKEKALELIKRLRKAGYNHAHYGKDMAIDEETAVELVEEMFGVEESEGK